ncbi:MAG: transposase [Bacteroidales bacterium]|nr:transposase [Bacteroidales bacterium]
MSHAYRIHDQSKVYFITLTIVEWVDVFTRPDQKMVIIDSLKYCKDKKGLQIFAYVIMTNHIHIICRAIIDTELSDIIRDFKRHTSKQITGNLDSESRKWVEKIFQKAGRIDPKNNSSKVWQRGYHAIEISSNKFLDQKIEYIHNNPVRAMIVQHPEDYLFSSARNYAGLDNYLDVIVTYGEWKTYS